MCRLMVLGIISQLLHLMTLMYQMAILLLKGFLILPAMLQFQLCGHLQQIQVTQTALDFFVLQMVIYPST